MKGQHDWQHDLYVQIADDAVFDDGLHDGFIEAQQQVAPALAVAAHEAGGHALRLTRSLHVARLLAE